MVVNHSDKRFYTREIREREHYRALGYADSESDDETWNNIHSATLEDYKLADDYKLLYTQNALDTEDSDTDRGSK